MNTYTERAINKLKTRPDLYRFKGHSTLYFSYLINDVIKDEEAHIDSLFIDYETVNKVINSL